MTDSRWPAESLISWAYSTISVGNAPLVMFDKDLGKANDRVEWGAQLVAHVGDELGFDPAGQLRFNPRAVLGHSRAMAQDSIAKQRGILANQRVGAICTDRFAEHRTLHFSSSAPKCNRLTNNL